MIFPNRFKYVTLGIFFLIWGYLIYCYIFGCTTNTRVHEYNYKSRVDSTISLIENWKLLVYSESYLRIRKSNFQRDSVLKELRKKPKVLIIPKEVTVEKYITLESNPKVMSIDQSFFINENNELKNLNNRLQREIDSLNDIVKKLETKRISDSVKYKPQTGGRKFLFFKSWKRKPSGPVETTPEFR